MSRGWICPVCGRGNAPFNLDCACHREPKQQDGALIDKQERSFIERMREQNAAPTVADFNRQQVKNFSCARCLQHGVISTHLAMEVCPYGGH